MGLALLALGGIASLACWIIVLIKMFKTEKPLLGVLGILCSLWAFIWGWMNATKLGIKNIMMIWTIAIIVSVIGNVMYSAAAVSQMQNLPTAP